jgi:hypothetical protein
MVLFWFRNTLRMEFRTSNPVQSGLERSREFIGPSQSLLAVPDSSKTAVLIQPELILAWRRDHAKEGSRYNELAAARSAFFSFL